MVVDTYGHYVSSLLGRDMPIGSVSLISTPCRGVPIPITQMGIGDIRLTRAPTPNMVYIGD